MEASKEVSSSHTKIVRKWHQLGASLSACLMSIVGGACFYMSSFLVPQLEDPESDLHVTEEEGSWFASLFLLGGLIGSLSGGLQNDRLGRRISLMIDNTLSIMSFAAMALAPNFATLLTGRFISGLAISSSFVTNPIYTSEISQPEIRILTGSFTVTCFSFGTGAVMLFGALFPWRVAVGIFCLPSIVALVGLYFSPETPVWLLRKGRDEAALKAMTFFRGDPVMAEEELKTIKESLMAQSKKNEKHISMLSQYKELCFSRSFIKPLLIVLALIIVGVEFSGTLVIGLYMVKVLQKTELPVSPYWAAAAVAVYRALLSIAASTLVPRFRRRPVFFVTGTVVTVSSFMLALHSYLDVQTSLLEGSAEWTNWIPLASIWLSFTGVAAGFYSTIYGFRGELFPAETRSLGCSLVGFVDSIIMFVFAKCIPMLMSVLGLYGLFGICATLVATMMVGMYFVLPETKGLSLEQIEGHFKAQQKLVMAVCLIQEAKAEKWEKKEMQP